MWLSLLLYACGSPTNAAREGTEGMTSRDASQAPAAEAEQAYRACVQARAAQVGTRDTISREKADEVVAECRHLLRPAADQVVARGGGETNLPQSMQTEESRVDVAMHILEHEAKMAISKHILPLPVR